MKTERVLITYEYEIMSDTDAVRNSIVNALVNRPRNEHAVYWTSGHATARIIGKGRLEGDA